MVEKRAFALFFIHVDPFGLRADKGEKGYET
jgi:hypothetical protein